MPEPRNVDVLIGRAPWWLALALAAPGCSLLIDVEHCKSDEACGPGHACHRGECVTLSPIDAVFDASGPETDGASEVDAAKPGACQSTDLPGLLATYDFGGVKSRRLEAALSHPSLAGFEFGFVPTEPFSVVYDGRFQAEQALSETFFVDTSGQAALRIDGVTIWEGTGRGTAEVMLRAGGHTLSLAVASLGADARVEVHSALPAEEPRIVSGPQFTAAADCDDVRGACQPVDDPALFEVEHNVFHCGACGRECTAEGSTTTCRAGACVPVCAGGREDADGDASNGCEAVVLRGELCGDLTHTGTVRIEDATVCPYDGREETGRVTVVADVILLAGTLDGRGRGFGGGGGGGGGGGTIRCGDTACPASPVRTFSGGRGGFSGPSGEPGRAGEVGRESTCFDAPPVSGGGGDGGDGGGPFGGAGGPGGALRVSTNAAALPVSGGDGGYGAAGRNGDESLDLSVSPGSGGGGGGGASGLAIDLCCSPAGGGGGGAGSPGGGAVALIARARLEILAGARLLTSGGDPEGGNGEPGTENGGVGGGAQRPEASIGGQSARPEPDCAPEPSLQAPPPGGNGGGGAGGGVLLQAREILIEGSVDAWGAQGARNGGTVKLASCGAPPDSARVRAGRVVDTLRPPDCD